VLWTKADATTQFLRSGERELKEGEMEEDLDEGPRNNEVVLSAKLFPKELHQSGRHPSHVIKLPIFELAGKCASACRITEVGEATLHNTARVKFRALHHGHWRKLVGF